MWNRLMLALAVSGLTAASAQAQAVAIQSMTGRFVRPGAAAPFTLAATTVGRIGAEETFVITSVPGPTISLRAANNNHVVVSPDNELVNASDPKGAVFNIVPLDGTWVALEAENKKFVTLLPDSDNLSASADKPGETEKFRIIQLELPAPQLPAAAGPPAAPPCYVSLYYCFPCHGPGAVVPLPLMRSHHPVLWYGDNPHPYHAVTKIDASNFGRLVLEAPPRAKLEIDGQALAVSDSTRRVFRSPSIAGSDRHTYTVRAEFEHNGQRVRQTRWITLHPGVTLTASFIEQADERVTQAER